MSEGGSFVQRARLALQNRDLRDAVQLATRRTVELRRRAVDELEAMAAEGYSPGTFHELRERARRAKAEVVAHLDLLVEQASRMLQSRGAHVYHAESARDVQEIVTRIARAHGVRLAVKSKSMVTEEVYLNEALEQAGVEVVETDLGEFILQLAHDRPSHLVMPVMHKSRREIAELFRRLAGRPVSTHTAELTAVARQLLREKFLQAGMGISGANFVVAETGTLVIATNEGNGRMVTSLPPVHVAVVGMEKLVATLQDLPVFLHLLARSATGQKLTVYTHLITGPRTAGEADGPEHLYVIFVDNGRRRVQQSPYREILHCIRCGACLNHCPVYQAVGGHAYGAVYSGPMGIVLTPQLEGLKRWSSLPVEACTLCGACTEVCPVGIPLHRLIVRERAELVRQGLDRSRLGRLLVWAGRLWSSPKGYLLSARLARAGWELARRAGLAPAAGRLAVLREWQYGRELPEPAPASFHELWAQYGRPVRAQPQGRDPDGATAPATTSATPAVADTPAGPARAAPFPPPRGWVERFARELERLGAVLRPVEDLGEAADYVAALARSARHGDGSVLMWEQAHLPLAGLREALEARGIPVRQPADDRATWARASVGLTGAQLAIAATGSLVLWAGPSRPRSASLLPWVHVALVAEDALVPTLEEALGRLPSPLPSSVVLISGPSRSADIENDLTIGVHGPGELHVLLVRGPHPADGA